MSWLAKIKAHVQWGSLKTRLTLLTVASFLVGLWSLVVFSSRTLHDDMQAILSRQQFATASTLAAGINHEVENRLAALEGLAASIDHGGLRNAAGLQDLLEQRPVLASMFNDGVLVLRPDGTAIAEVPRATGRIGGNLLDDDGVAATLGEGKARIGRPHMGKTSPAPMFAMTVPVRDAAGRVVGAVSGVTRLDLPNFLERVFSGGSSQRGSFSLVSKPHRLIVTSTDRRLIMKPLPGVGANALRERFIAGYEGSGIATNFFGVEVLASAKGVPAANWFLVAALPTAEAFAPIRNVQRRTLLGAIVLTVLSGGLTWWILRRQLSPLLAALKELSRLHAGQPLQALPVTRHDEIGELITGFNSLLEALTQREADLRESEERLNEAQSIAHLGNWTIDLAVGKLVWTLELFRLLEVDPDPALATYENFVAAVHPDDVAAVKTTYTRAFKTRLPTEITHRLRMRDGRIKWVHDRFVVSFDALGAPLHANGTVQDITERKLAEEQRLAEARQQRDTLVREVHHRIKNHLQGLAGLLENELGRQAEHNPRLETAISQVYAIAVVHGLQASSSDEAIRLCDSVGNICRAVSGLSSRGVGLRIEGEENRVRAIRVNSDEAVAVALVLNELILNAVKHSPVGSRDPWVSLSADETGAKICIVNVSKTGPTFDIDNGHVGGMGLRLVRALLPQQGAELSRELDAEGLMTTRLRLTGPVVIPAGLAQ
ncbi:MAG: PAS domain-containing protein [Rhodocyclales bacterium]|nr:PAS domain-containing protein [Rhodocyclales bacterium]